MSREEYKKALKLGKRDYQMSLLKGEIPTLPSLDSILPADEGSSVEKLGLVQIPLDQIVGTRYAGRSNAFAGNFMPILSEDSEFAYKWWALSDAHMEEGIKDPIKVVEYKHKFYVEEGNKRVSVMKFFKSVSIAGYVTRILPKKTEENRLYYEFLDFYKLSEINYLWFTKEGCFKKLQELMGKAADEKWTDDDKLDFNSAYVRFSEVYESMGGKKLSITVGDAFLGLAEVYGYEALVGKTIAELKELLGKSWEEFELLDHDDEVELKMDPSEEKKPLLSRLLPIGKPKLKIAFISAKTPMTSAWTYGHELGRLHLERTFPDSVSTVAYNEVTVETVEACIEQAIAEGCKLIFTTTPVFTQASVKAAIAHPEVRILNCSLNTTHRYIRTYYTRMHEAKFLMGAIAGAMAENDRLSYIADYPLYGTIAHINAFALGAKMVNPRAKVYLEWTSLKDIDILESIRNVDPSCISGKDMVLPDDVIRYYGIYHMENGRSRNLAMPLCHWGKFYEKLVHTIMDGTWKQEDSPGKAINYWWGMSAGVVDVICSKNLPVGTRRLVDFLKNTISSGQFRLFSGELYSQNGLVQDEKAGALTPEQVMEMDWLAENVVGHIPVIEEVVEQAKPVISAQGLKG